MFATATVASAEIGAAEKRALRGRAGFGDCFCRASIPATIRNAEREIRRMTAEERRSMNAACVQAAATLIAARGKGQIDIEECIRLAALIYVRVVKTDWREPA
jgi:hypothetical protein